MKLGPILRAHGFSPKKRYGQHFLVEDRILAAIVQAAAIRPGDRVLEIGPGAGTLTRALAEAGARVHAVEIDRTIEPVLREVMGDLPYEITWGDALRVPLPSADKVVANLPYEITAPLLERLLTQPFQQLVLMVQREVAERMLAQPGTRSYGAFTLFVRYHARAELALAVPRGAFLPPPLVASAVVRLTPESRPYPREAFLEVVRLAFRQRRKTIANALGRHPALEVAGVDGSRRAETLSLDEFGALALAWTFVD